MSQGENDELGGAADQAMKIQALRDMIMNAERTIQGAKSMLLQIEGKKKTGRPKKSEEDGEEGTVVQGTFDGQFMMGTDGKQYPVPANYASKSKLVEGDMLKLTITYDGSFIYKQVGPIERRHAIGIVTQDERGNYQIVADNQIFRILLASITYFRLEPGDEVAILLPRNLNATFAVIENVLRKGALVPEEALAAAKNAQSAAAVKMESWKDSLKDAPSLPSDEPEGFAEKTPAATTTNPLDDWIRDMEELETEMKEKTEQNDPVTA